MQAECLGVNLQNLKADSTHKLSSIEEMKQFLSNPHYFFMMNKKSPFLDTTYKSRELIEFQFEKYLNSRAHQNLIQAKIFIKAIEIDYTALNSLAAFSSLIIIKITY